MSDHLDVETPTMHRLRPFHGYVTVIESPVDEAQRQSGLIVPLTAETGKCQLERGVVLQVADLDANGMPRALDGIREGSVIYYRHGDRILDVIVVPFGAIVAYMDDE
jgi:hypothetical protein